MKKLISIVSVLALSVFFTGCEKCAKPTFEGDPFVNADSYTISDDENVGPTRANSSNGSGSQGAPGDITDPNEDQDFDNIVDPDEDEDFDEDGK